MMPLHYNRTAVVDGTASVHHRLAFMMGCFMDCRTVMDRAAFVYSRSVMSGTAFVHHRLCLVLWCFMYSRPVMGRAALVHHRLRLVMLCAPVHACDAVCSGACRNPAVWECSYEPPGPDVRDCFDA